MKWMNIRGLSTCLAAAMALSTAVLPVQSAYEPGGGSKINRGQLQLSVAQESVVLEQGGNVSVNLTADPWQDMQTKGCQMAECPDSCGEGCFAEDGINCTCAGTEMFPYDAGIYVESSDSSVVTANYENHTVVLRGVGSGTATVTVTGVLREWTPAETQIAVVVNAGSGGGQGGSGGSGALPTPSQQQEVVKLSYGKDGNVTVDVPSLKQASELQIAGPLGLILDGAALDTIGREHDLRISALKIDNKTLTATQQKVIGARPGFAVELTTGEQTVSALEKGAMHLSIPYAPAGEERTDRISAFILLKDGRLKKVPGSRYDQEAKAVVFSAGQSAVYAVGYQVPMEFDDVGEKHWAATHIQDLVDRGAVSGKEHGRFAPEDSITRAEIVKILAYLSGKTGEADSVFSDVPAGAWYASSVAWGAERGIVKGGNGMFYPLAPISRQDMAVILERYALEVAGTALTGQQEQLTFEDQSAISSYARDAVMAMQTAGVVVGGGIFRPMDPVTRAEASKMISVLLAKLDQAGGV